MIEKQLERVPESSFHLCLNTFCKDKQTEVTIWVKWFLITINADYFIK